MTDLMTRGQIDQLARILGTDPAELGFLQRLGAQRIRELADSISNSLFDTHAEIFARVSKLAPLVPNSLAAKVSMKAVPAEVSGRAGGAIGLDHPDRAAGLLADLTPDYMADAAPYLDPRAISVLAPRIPARVLIPSARELLRRHDFVTAAKFVEHATPDLIGDFEKGIDDDEGLLRTAALTPSTERLNDIVRLIPDERRQRLLSAATTSTDVHLLAGLSVLSRLDDDMIAALGNALFDDVDDDAVDRILTVAVAQDAIQEFFTIVGRLNKQSLDRIAARPRFSDPEVRAALDNAADTEPRRRVLKSLVDLVP